MQFSFLGYFVMISASGDDIVEIPPQHFPAGSEEYYKNLSYDTWHPNQDSRRTQQEQCNYVVLLADLEGSNIHVQ